MLFWNFLSLLVIVTRSSGCHSKGSAWDFYTTFLTGSDEECSVSKPTMPSLSAQMNQYLIQVLREKCVWWPPPLPDLDFVWGTTVIYFPEAMNRWLLPPSCIWPSSGSYLSSSSTTCSLPCFAEGGTNMESRCFITAMLRNESWLTFFFVLLPPALIDTNASHSCKSYHRSIVVTVCAVGSWSYLSLETGYSWSWVPEALCLLPPFCRVSSVKVTSSKRWESTYRAEETEAEYLSHKDAKHLTSKSC